MKYIKLFENFDQTKIYEICKKYGIKNYTINPDGSIDVDGNVNLDEFGLTKLPLKFNKVFGDFSCSDNKLTTLENSPNYVGGDFKCQGNKLTDLKNGPKEVRGVFNCNYNRLTTLEGSTKEVGSNFACAMNKLTSLDGYPNYLGYFKHGDNPISPIIDLFGIVKIYLEYQDTFKFLRKDCKIVKHLLEEAIKDYNEYYNKNVKLPDEIKGYTYI
jgi:hypothetical protein